MMFILANFGIYLDLEVDYQFTLNSKNFPNSPELKEIINNLIPLGKIKKLSNYVKLDNEVENDIKIISSMIRKYIKGTQKEVSSLKKISKILYTGKNSIPTDAALEEISKFCQYPVKEVKSCLTLRKKIANKL